MIGQKRSRDQNYQKEIGHVTKLTRNTLILKKIYFMSTFGHVIKKKKI